MNREEFEAVLAIEGKYISVHPIISRKDVWWKAIVWEWVDMPTMLYHKRRILYGDVGEPQPEELKRVRYTLGVTNPEKTNHKAVKHLMQAWEKGYF